jgi:hypothetical protein
MPVYELKLRREEDGTKMENETIGEQTCATNNWFASLRLWTRCGLGSELFKGDEQRNMCA